MLDTLPKLDDSFPKLIPHLRSFVSGLEHCIANKEPLLQLREELHQCDVVMSAFILAFKYSVRGYDYNEEELPHIAQVYADFEGTAGVLSSLICDLKSEDAEGAVRDVNALVEQLKETEKSLAKLEELKKAKTKMSEFVGIDSVLKAGLAVAEGRREWDMLENCLDSLRPAFERLVACNSLPDHIEDYCEALDDLFKICEQQNLEELPAALESFKGASEIMIAKYNEVKASKQANDSSRSWNCPKCGVDLGEWDKRCPKCGLRLPDRSVVEQNLNECCNCTDLPGCVQIIFDSINGLRDGGDCWRAFSEGLSEYAAFVEDLKCKYASLPESAFNSSSSAGEALILSREAVEEGLTKLENAYYVCEHMQNGGEVTDEELDAALENMVEGVEQTRQITSMV
ncbi:MAG: hypothetical protein ACI38Q_03370 [Candidatus Bruticola sp.]